jgi:hypothetical protein
MLMKDTSDTPFDTLMSRNLIRILNVAAELEALYAAAHEHGVPPDEITRGPFEDMDEKEREAVLMWSKEKGCSVEDVPIVPALEQLRDQLRREVQGVAFRGREKILFSHGGRTWEALVGEVLLHVGTPESDADFLEADLYARFPEMHKRAQRVCPLVISGEVPDGLLRRYKEAVRSYIFGNPIACCALCRAVVEAALRLMWERRHPDAINVDSFDLAGIIDVWDRTKELPQSILAIARRVKDEGNYAVHAERVLKSDEALQSLLSTQQVVKALFAEGSG